MINLSFTDHVLGKSGSERLREKLVSQTLRSKPLDRKVGEELSVWMHTKGKPAEDQIPIGLVKLQSVDRVKWQDLMFEDAHKGGFDNLEDLGKALKRAGFRFQPLEEYSFYRIKFEWVKP